jgi:hypothetical protein
MRGVREALPDLTRHLIHRALALGQYVNDLSPPATAQRLRHRRERVEECILGDAITHTIKLSLEFSIVNRVSPNTHRLTAILLTSASRPKGKAMCTCEACRKPPTGRSKEPTRRPNPLIQPADR